MLLKQISTPMQRLCFWWLAVMFAMFSAYAVAEEEFLLPDEAFTYSLEATDDGQVLVHWHIVPHYYLYKEQFDIADENGTLAEQEWPTGEYIEDEFFGRSEVYFNTVTAKVDPGEATSLTLTWQGCAEAGLCYPPQEATVKIPAPGSKPGALEGVFGTKAPSSSASSAAPSAPEQASEQGEDQRLATQLASASVGWAVVVFFGLGLLLVFTPCVLPMLPVLSSLVVGSESRSRRQAFVLSLAYVVPMALTYAVMGVLAAMAGANLQAVLQQPAVLAVFAGLFVLLAAAMFGLYELQLPAWLRDRLNNMSQQQQGGTLWGAGLMGVLSAILVGPCMTAPLAGALLYIAESGNLWLGGLTLFALGLGMGAPLVLAMTIGAGFLPKPGGWMDSVKAVFGFMLLGLAIWFMQRVLPGEVVLALSGLLGVAMAFALWHSAREAQFTRPVAPVLKALALSVGLWATLMVVGGAAGNKDPLRPLQGVAVSGTTGSAADTNFISRFQTMATVAELEQALERAQQEGRWVIVDYFAEWCISCHVIEREVFGNAEVQAALADVVLLRPDVTAPGQQSKALLDKYSILGPPTILFISPDGEERRGQRVVGELSAKAFIERLQQAQRN